MTTTVLKIFIALLSKEHLTASELASRFMVSKKTIYRAIDNLSSAGIPVYTMTGKNGGIFLDKNFNFRELLKNK